MNNLPLQPLVWDWSYGDGGKTNAVCRAKSPSHEYIIRLEAGGDCYVDYRKFDNDEDSDNRKDEPPVFDSIKAAQDWVQSTHYPSKMQPYVRPTPTWISVEDRLPEMHKRVLIKADCYLVAGREPKSERNKDWGISGDWMWAIVNDSWTDSHMVTHWMPIPEFSTMQNNKGE